MQHTLNTEEETKAIAHKIASTLKAGDVIALTGDLGAGKTFLAREIIRFFCGADLMVPSPTFTLLQIYETKPFNIYHYDLYRLKSADEIYDLGIEEAFDNNICLIEWPEIIAQLLPSSTIHINLELQNNIRLLTLDNQYTNIV